jgi:Domain of unknown function (DUF4395)
MNSSVHPNAINTPTTSASNTSSDKSLNALKLDPNVLRFNQISIITGIILAALTGQAWIVAPIAAIMLAGTFNPKLAVFKNTYSGLIRPALKWPVNLQDDDPRAHNFAQGVGGVFLAVATLAFLTGWTVFGWSVSGIVVLLALLNLTTNICVGCLMYFQWRMLQHRFARIRSV